MRLLIVTLTLALAGCVGVPCEYATSSASFEEQVLPEYLEHLDRLVELDEYDPDMRDLRREQVARRRANTAAQLRLCEEQTP